MRDTFRRDYSTSLNDCLRVDIVLRRDLIFNVRKEDLRTKIFLIKHFYFISSDLNIPQFFLEGKLEFYFQNGLQ